MKTPKKYTKNCAEEKAKQMEIKSMKNTKKIKLHEKINDEITETR